MALNWSECIICQDSNVNEPLRCPKATNIFGSSEDKLKKSYDKFVANIQRALFIYDMATPLFAGEDWRYQHKEFHKLFLDASLHLYKRVCPSVGPSVRPSVGR